MTLLYLLAVNSAVSLRNSPLPERAVKILFAFENPLPNAQADAEVFDGDVGHGVSP